MPWYSRVLHYVRPLPIRLEFDLTEHEPYGLKDERVRALVVSAMQSGRFRPGRRVQHAAALVRQLQRAGVGGEARPRQGAPARAHRASARRRHGEPEERRTTCRRIWAAWSTRWCSTTAITWSRSTSSATSWPSAPPASWNGCRARFAPGARWRASPAASRRRRALVRRAPLKSPERAHNVACGAGRWLQRGGASCSTAEMRRIWSEFNRLDSPEPGLRDCRRSAGGAGNCPRRDVGDFAVPATLTDTNAYITGSRQDAEVAMAPQSRAGCMLSASAIGKPAWRRAGVKSRRNRKSR